ncbi:MAG: cobalamin-dependent protein, partial [Syntrophales bacterium]|nr:cobalamin-dependent protein [Syntrophales bacterium]
MTDYSSMQNKRLLLIEPPFYRLYGEKYALVKYPLSLAYLALAVREKTDWDVKVLNADFAPATEPFDVTYLTGEGFRRYTENIESPDAQIWRSIRAFVSDYQPTVVGISVKSSTLASAYRIARMVKELNRKIMVVVGGPHPSATGPEMLANADIDVTVPG